MDQPQFFGHAGYVQIQWANQLGWLDVFPEAQVNIVLPYHPPQEHIDPFTGRSLCGRCNVFLRSAEMRALEKIVFKIDQSLLHRLVFRVHAHGEGSFKAGMLLIVKPEKINEIQKIVCIESAMLEPQQ